VSTIGGVAQPASIAVQRRVEWSDTDASGHHHFTAVLRWVEEAESLLHERLCIADTTLGRNPRVHLEVDFARTLLAGVVVDVQIAVTRVGRSSVAYDFAVLTAGERAASGSVVAVLVSEGGAAEQWPPEVRARLAEGGVVAGERYQPA
jgi:acyl-CoA thioesterase FadM